MEKAIITVVGKDKVGIIAKVCNYLAEHNINIMDISQTIVDGYFNMMMIVCLDNIAGGFDEVNDGLYELSKTIGVSIKFQHANIFEEMHRI